jgi:AcrR family transcriptional regulator
MARSISPRRGDQTGEAIRAAAIRLFALHGYEATTLRGLASEVGITVGSVYNHIESKESLLYSLMSAIMDDLLDGANEALAGEQDPLELLRLALEFHISFHVNHAQEVFIGNSELRSLSGERRAAVVALRDQYEQLFDRILHEGMNSGAFAVTEPRLITRAILAMGTSVANWYSREGRHELGEIAMVYFDFVLRALRNGTPQVRFVPNGSSSHQGGPPPPGSAFPPPDAGTSEA